MNTVASRIAKNRDALLVYNIDILDSNENLRSTYDILSDLAPKWEQMSNSEKVALGTTLAGVNQYKVFSAVMNNFESAIKATEDALQSEGATERQNAVYMESLQAKLSMLKQEFQKFVLGDGGLSNFVKWLLNAGIAVLKFANSDIGKLTIKLTLLTSVIKTVVVAFKSGDNALGKFLLNSNILVLSNGKLTLSFEALKTAILTNPLFIGLSVATTIVGITSLISSLGLFKSEAQKTKERHEELVKSIDESTEEYKELSEQIDETEKRLEELNKKIEESSQLNGVNQDYLRYLRLEKQELEQTLALLKLKAKYEQSEAETSAKDYLSEETVQVGTKTVYDTHGNYTREKEEGIYQNPIEALKTITGKYQEVARQIDELQAKGEKVPSSLSGTLRFLGEQATNLSTELLKANDALDGLDDTTFEVDESEQALKNTIQEVIDSWIALSGVEDEEKNTEEELTEQYNELAKQYGITEDQIQEYIDANKNADGSDMDRNDAISALVEEMDASAKITNILKERLKELDNVALKDIDGAFKNVAKAVNELNSANGLTLDTYESLMSLDVDYLSVLFDEEGNLRNTADAQRELYYAKIDNIGISQALLLIEKAEEVEANNGANAYVNYAKGIDTATNSMWGLVYAKIADANVSDSSKSVLNKQVKSMENMAKQAKKNYKSYTGATSATRSHTGATKENTNALKENVEMLKKQKEALDDEVDKYEKVIAYINSKLDDEIDRLEDLKDTEVENIDVRIDKLQDLADAKDDYYNKEIEKIKELKDQDKEYWNERIQELKDANNELEEQLELQKLLDALESAKRKKVKVYQDGKGFVYQTDQNVVSQAQKNLDEYYRKKSYQDQLKELENQRNAQEKIYDKQIEDLEKKQKEEKELYDKEIKDLENQKKKVEDKYNGLIKIFQDYKDKFKDQTDAYETEQNRLLALQLTGIDFEKDNWQQLLVMQTEGAKAENDIYSSRLGALQSFADAYMEKQKQLQQATEEYNKALEKYNQAQQTSSSSGGGGGGFGIGATGQPTTTPTYYYVYQQLGSFRDQSSAQTSAQNYKNAHRDAIVSIKKDGNSWYALKRVGNAYTSLDKAKGQANALTTQSLGKTIYRAYNKGVSSIDSDQMAIVGENPNKEIVIGSKLNNGVMTKLPKGSGVVNARSTNTLAGIINQLGFAKSNFGIGSGNPINNDSSQNFIIENVTIDGANITDMNSFRNSLMNLKSEATQRAYRRK